MLECVRFFVQRGFPFFTAMQPRWHGIGRSHSLLTQPLSPILRFVVTVLLRMFAGVLGGSIDAETRDLDGGLVLLAYISGIAVCCKSIEPGAFMLLTVFYLVTLNSGPLVVVCQYNAKLYCVAIQRETVYCVLGSGGVVRVAALALLKS